MRPARTNTRSQRFEHVGRAVGLHFEVAVSEIAHSAIFAEPPNRKLVTALSFGAAIYHFAGNIQAVVPRQAIEFSANPLL
jgi:hypothetical protein